MQHLAYIVGFLIVGAGVIWFSDKAANVLEALYFRLIRWADSPKN